MYTNSNLCNCTPITYVTDCNSRLAFEFLYISKLKTHTGRSSCDSEEIEQLIPFY